MNDLERKASEYNKCMMEIFTALVRKFPSDMDINSVVNKLKLAKSTDIECIITSSGPYLFKYREKILSNDYDFIFSGKFDEINDVRESKERSDIFNKVKAYKDKLSEGEISFIENQIHKLLKIYLEYCKLAKSKAV